MAKFTARTLPRTANVSKEAEQFIKSAEVSAKRKDSEADYPWQDASQNLEIYIPFGSRLSRKQLLKFDYLCKHSRISKRILLEEALDNYIDAYFSAHGIPND